MYEEIAKGIHINTNIYTYEENLKRQIKENKRIIDKMENYINELIANGVTAEIAKAIGRKYFYNVKKKMVLVAKGKNTNYNVKHTVELRNNGTVQGW